MADINLAFLLFPILALISLGLGATLTWADFKKTTRKQIIVAWCCQYGVMPLLSFIFAKMFQFDLEVTIGMILVGCAPGSTSSNIWVYWSNNNLSLSVVIVIINTIFAFGMFPLLVLIYVDIDYYSAKVQIDFVNITLALLIVLIPVAIGVYLRYLNPKRMWREKYLWQWLEKFTSGLGALFVIVPLVVGIIQNKSLFSESGKMWVASIIFQPLGCLIGYWLTIATGLPKVDARTISLQTGIQSATLVIAIISLTFPDKYTQDRCLIFPLFYSFWYIINSGWLTVLFHRLARDDAAATAAQDPNKDTKPVPLDSVATPSPTSN
jgi:BASS family bile acid:Na+ symporter